jgi:hypothetical protein
MTTEQSRLGRNKWERVGLSEELDMVFVKD